MNYNWFIAHIGINIPLEFIAKHYTNFTYSDKKYIEFRILSLHFMRFYLSFFSVFLSLALNISAPGAIALYLLCQLIGIYCLYYNEYIFQYFTLFYILYKYINKFFILPFIILFIFTFKIYHIAFVPILMLITLVLSLLQNYFLQISFFKKYTRRHNVQLTWQDIKILKIIYFSHYTHLKTKQFTNFVDEYKNYLNTQK